MCDTGVCAGPSDGCNYPSTNDIPIKPGTTYQGARDIVMQNLKERYRWYMDRYLNAYREYQNTTTDKEKCGNYVKELNSTLKDIIVSLRQNNQDEESSLEQSLNAMDEDNNNIRVRGVEVGAFEDKLRSKQNALLSTDAILSNEVERSRYMKNSLIAYSVLNIVLFILLVGLFWQMNRGGILE